LRKEIACVQAKNVEGVGGNTQEIVNKKLSL
jgi:hypothetical protein